MMKSSPRHWRSLKTRLTLLSLVIFLTGIWLLLLSAGGMLRKDLERLLGEQQFAMASILAVELDFEIDFRLRSLEKVAQGLTPETLNDPAASQALLEARPILPGLFSGGYFVTGVDGTVIASLPLSANRRGLNFMDRDYVVAALKEGKSGVGKPVMGKTLHAPAFAMAAPIRADGRIIGALVGVVDLSRPNFLNEVSGSRYGKGGAFLLVAPQYRIIVTSSDKSRTMEQLPPPGANPAIDRFIGGYEGFQLFANPRGVEVLAAVKRVPTAGWYVAVVQPTEELFAPIRRVQRHMLVAATVLTLLAGGLTWWMLRRQLSPLLDAVRMLSHLSNSGLSIPPLPITRDDEVGELMGAFNGLLETLTLREAALIESDENHRSILQSALNGVWQADAAGKLLDFNDAYRRMTGYDPQELLGMNISQLEDPEPGGVMDRMQFIRERGEARFDTRYRCKGGSLIDVEVNARYNPLGGGRCVAFVHDITARKGMIEELRRSRDEWSRTFDAMRELIFIINDEYRILEINQAALNALGVTREEALNTHCYVHMHGADAPPDCCPQSKTLLNHGEHCIKALLAPLGRHYQVTTTPIFADDGSYRATVHVAHDVTESTEYERDLELARDAAESANRAKSEFLSNMSHEIRTPMNGIMGMAQLLAYTRLTDEQKEYLDAIKMSSDNLLTLINDILDLSRIESGKLELERRNFSLRRSIGDVIRTQFSSLQGKGLSMLTDISDLVPDHLTGDQLRMKQILLNLLGNAIKFTQKGGICIAVTVTQRHDNVVLLTIAVTDSGIGISPPAMTKIFEPFVQADGSTTRQFGGTGLGLAICTRLAEKMGGKVWGESKEGVGSTFFLQIPFAVIEEAPEQDGGRSSGGAPPAWEGPGLTILLVDDQEINLAFASRILQKNGHTVVEARNGLMALEKWGEEAIDLILMDIQMPVMNGIEATQAIRGREREVGGHIPIIAVTARALHEEQAHILAQGFDGYVTKPFEIGKLLGEMKRCVADVKGGTCAAA